MTLADRLTICSVSFGEGPLLALNRRLTAHLNEVVPRWLAVRNMPVQTADDTLGEEGSGFDLVEGVALDEGTVGTRAPRSMHHALALNLVPQHVDTRFVMYLDPDCFVVRPDWVEEVLAHMLAHDLATFGVPYHPRAPRKIRYVPCGVGMVVDTQRLALEGLDWTPGTVEDRDRGMESSRADRMIQALLTAAKMPHRLTAGASVDTGVDFYRRHRAERAATECAQSVMQAGYMRAKLKHPRERVLEVLLPDRYCWLPKQPGYITDRSFAHAGYEDTATMGCEEFMWRDEPFALHLRGGPPELREDHGAIERLVGQFLREPSAA